MTDAKTPGALALALLLPLALSAQVPPDIARERAAHAEWLLRDPRSPFAALALQPVGRGLTVGAAPSDVELPDIGRATLTEDGAVVYLSGAAAGSRRALPRWRLLPFGPYRLVIDGEPGRSVAVVYGEPRGAHAAEWYPYDPALVVTGALEPPARAGTQRLLALDGVEVGASPAGTFTAELAGSPIRLAVYRMPDPAGEEVELMIYFRDATSDRGSYPAGRFVALQPVAGGRYRLDFNRARNPLCAYSAVFPCPVPWAGNGLPMPIAAGEKYVPSAPSRP